MTEQQQAEELEQLVTIQHVAAQWDCTPSQIARWVEKGYMPGPRRIGRRLRFSIRELNQWLEDGCPGWEGDDDE